MTPLTPAKRRCYADLGYTAWDGSSPVCSSRVSCLTASPRVDAFMGYSRSCSATGMFSNVRSFSCVLTGAVRGLYPHSGENVIG